MAVVHPALEYDAASHVAHATRVAIAPSACNSSSRWAIATASRPASITRRNPNSNPVCAPYSGTADATRPNTSGMAAAPTRARVSAASISGFAPARRPNVSAANDTTAKRRKMPIASESWLALKNWITQPH